MENNINFKTEIEKKSILITTKIVINNYEVDIQLIKFKQSVCEIFLNWQTVFGMIGKNKKSSYVIKILFCLLSDYCIIKSINKDKCGLDLYDPELDRFTRLEVVDEKKRDIKLKIFNICNHMIVIDCRDMKKYSVYELQNCKLLKDYYENYKINMDDIILTLKLKPVFTGDIKNLLNDFGILSTEKKELDYDEYIDNLEKRTKELNLLENKINKLYLSIFNKKSS